MKHIVTFFVCLLSVNGIILLSGLAAWVGSWWWSIAAAVVLALAVIVLGVFRQSGALWWAAFAGCFGGILGNQTLYQIRLLLTRPVVENVRADAIASHPEAAAFTLTGVRVLHELWGYHRVRSTRTSGKTSHSSSRDVYAAPLVDADWTPEKPVAAWVVCGEVPGCRKNWEKPPGAAIRMEAGNQDLDAFRAAAEDAVRGRGLTMSADPVFLEWAESYEAYRSGEIAWYKLTVIIWNFVWFIPWVVWRIVALFRRKPQAPAQPSSAVK